MDSVTQKKMEQQLKNKAVSWMRRNYQECDNATQLAENCAYYFDPDNSYEAWLDDDTHWIWDIAAEFFMERSSDVEKEDN